MTELREYVSTATETTLSSGITNLSTALTVVNNSGYPTVFPYAIKVQDESILVGGSSGNTFNTLTRAYDSTVAVAHSSGVTVQHAAIGDDFRNRWIDTKTVRPGGTYDDEFGSTTLDTAWVEVTPTGTAAWTQSNGVLSVLGANQTANDIAVIVKPLPVFPAYEIHTAARYFGPLTNYTMVGLVFTDGTDATSNCAVVFIYATTTSGQVIGSFRTGTVTNITTTVAETSLHMNGPWLHMKLKWKAINTFGVEFSSDGVSWTTLGLADASFTFTPTHAGLMFTTWGGATNRTGTFEYYRGKVT